MLLPLLLLVTAPSLSADSEAAPAQTPAAPAAPVVPKWTGAVSLGATYSDGNTNRRSGSATADAEYRREHDRTTLGFLWNYAEEEGVTTDRKTQARAKYDRFFSKKVYGLVQASAEADFQAALDRRYTLGAGMGYQFSETPTWKLSGELGLSYVDSDYEGTVDDTAYLAARAAYTWDWKPNTKYNVNQAAEIFPSLENGDDVNARVDTKGRMNLTDKMFAQLQWLYQWDNTPATGKVRSDNLLVLGVGWSF
jgi:putative salt-induced outer membrane protein YdiY